MLPVGVRAYSDNNTVHRPSATLHLHCATALCSVHRPSATLHLHCVLYSVRTLTALELPYFIDQTRLLFILLLAFVRLLFEGGNYLRIYRIIRCSSEVTFEAILGTSSQEDSLYYYFAYSSNWSVYSGNLQ